MAGCGFDADECGGCVLFVALLGGKGRYRLIDGGAKYDSSLISTLLSDIDKYYYFHDDAPDTEKLLEDAAHDIVNSIGDPYAAYYTNEEYEAFENSINGSYKGIGVLLGVTDGNGAEIVRVYEGNPAAKAGIREGDTVIAVDGKSTLGLPHEEVSDLISGLDGTTVALTIKRGEETLEIDVERGDVYIKRVYTEILEALVISELNRLQAMPPKSLTKALTVCLGRALSH